MSMHNHESHVLWKSKAEDPPPGILDRNGAVVVDMCRHCGKTESELIDPCDKVPREMTQKMHNDRAFADLETIERGWQCVRETFPKDMTEDHIEFARAVFFGGAMYAVHSPGTYAVCYHESEIYSRRMSPELARMMKERFGV